jgi:hypothetical protein
MRKAQPHWPGPDCGDTSSAGDIVTRPVDNAKQAALHVVSPVQPRTTTAAAATRPTHRPQLATSVALTYRSLRQPVLALDVRRSQPVVRSPHADSCRMISNNLASTPHSPSRPVPRP